MKQTQKRTNNLYNRDNIYIVIENGIIMTKLENNWCFVANEKAKF